MPVRSGRRSGGVGFPGQALHPHGGVVVVDHLALSGQRDQSLMHRFESLARLGHEFPLGGGGQAHPQIGLHFVQPIVWQAPAETQIAQHGTNPGIILAQPGFGRRGGGEDSSAEVAAQFLQLKAGGGKESLGRNAHDLRGPFQPIEFAFFAVGARGAGMELEVGHGDAFGPGIVRRRRAAVALALGRGVNALAVIREPVSGGGGKSWRVFSVFAPKISRCSRPRLVSLASMTPMTQ